MVSGTPNLYSAIAYRQLPNHQYKKYERLGNDATEDQELEHAKNLKFDDLKIYIDIVKASGIIVFDQPWQTDKQSRDAIQAEFGSIIAGHRIDGSTWKNANNELIPLSNRDFLDLAKCVKDYSEQVMYAAWEIKSIIQDLDNISDVVTFDLTNDEAIWPSKVFESKFIDPDVNKIVPIKSLLAKLNKAEETIANLTKELDNLKGVIKKGNSLKVVEYLEEIDEKIWGREITKRTQYFVMIQLKNKTDSEIDRNALAMHLKMSIPPIEVSWATNVRLNGDYILTPTKNLKAGKRLTITLKFVGVTPVAVSVLGYIVN